MADGRVGAAVPGRSVPAPNAVAGYAPPAPQGAAGHGAPVGGAGVPCPPAAFVPVYPPPTFAYPLPTPAPSTSAPPTPAPPVDDDTWTPGRIYKMHGRWLGLAFGLLVAFTYAGQLALGAWCRSLLPTGAGTPRWMSWLLSFLPLYGLGFPIFMLHTQRMIYIRPPRQKLRVGRFVGFFCMALALMYLGALLGNGVNWLLGLLRGQQIDSALQAIADGAPVWQMLLFTCLLAPVGEEMIFGRLLERSLPYGERPAILFCALTFAAFHGNLYQFFYAFLVRLLLARLYLCSGSLFACIGLHSLLNFVGGVLGQQMLGAGEKALAAYGLALVLTVGAGTVLLARRWRHTPLRRGRPGAKARWLFINAGVVISLLAILYVMVLSM